MKIIDKITPKFIQEHDQRLLLKKPVLWVFKLHHLLFFQLVFTAVTFFFCWIHPQGLNNFPHSEVIITIIGVLNGLLVLLWMFYANQFDLRTRHISTPRWYDQYRMGSYMLAGLALVFSGLACYTILQVNTTRVMLPLDDAKFAAMDSVVDDFSRNGDHYADGYYLESIYHKETQQFLRKDTIWYEKDTVLRRCTAIGKLNEKWGDGVLYTGQAVYDSIIDSVGFGKYDGKRYSISFYSRIDFIDELKYNVGKVERSYRFLHQMPGDLEEFTWGSLMVLVLVFGILYLLIIYFKYFGIYQVITGVLSPVLLYLVFGLLAFLWFEVFLGDDDSGSVLAIMLLVVLATFGYAKGFAYSSTSKRQIALLQSLVVVVPTVLLMVHFIYIDNCLECWQYDRNLLQGYDSYGDGIYTTNPEYLACLAEQKMIETASRWILLLAYIFILFPMNTNLFYKQYYLPKNR